MELFRRKTLRYIPVMETKEHKNEIIIYVAILDEKVDVWRPVRAQKIDNKTYLIIDNETYDPNIEKWQFPPGSQVLCEFRKLQEDEVLLAIKRL
jgi:hypothetical protein